MLKSFYTSYITQFSKDEPFEPKLDSIKKIYCTSRLIKEIKAKTSNGEIDWDILINAQDSDTSYLNSLKIKLDPEIENLYHISYGDSRFKEKVRINLIVVKEKEVYKIDKVLY